MGGHDIRQYMPNSKKAAHEDKKDKKETYVVGIHAFPPRKGPPPPETFRDEVKNVDIIAVHGLDGHWLRSWRARDGAIWLRDRLPQLLEKKGIQARILSFGYDSKFAFTKEANNIDMLAENFLNQIHSIRTKKEQREVPIIFVGHGLGGLVIKTALNQAWMENLGYQHIASIAAGCVFLGVPQRGATLGPWLRVIAAIANTLSVGSKNPLGDAISRNSNVWATESRMFASSAANAELRIATLFETLIDRGLIMDQKSCELKIGREVVAGLPNTDHHLICKFSNSNSEDERFFDLGDLMVDMVNYAVTGIAVADEWRRKSGRCRGADAKPGFGGGDF